LHGNKSHAHLLLGRAHVGPSALALSLNSTLGSISTEVVGDDGAGMLHVQKVGGQGTLRRVGVVSALLALLLLLSRRAQVAQRHEKLPSSGVEAGEEVGMALSRGLTQEQVGLANIVVGEVAEQLQNGLEATNSLDSSCQRRLRHGENRKASVNAIREGKESSSSDIALIVATLVARRSSKWSYR
jgi:hypothetical protein